MPRWVFYPKNKKIKGLVPAFLLAVYKLTHASINKPVRMPLKPFAGKKEPTSSTQIAAKNVLPNHTPTGYSSDKH